MRHYRTKEDLDLVLSQEKPEPVIRLFWFDYKRGEVYKKFVDELINGTYDENGGYIPSKYETEYPETNEDGNPINYVEYNEVDRKFNPETGEEEIIPVLPDECYEEKEVEDELGNKITEKVIKEDCKYRPTKELYLELHEDEFKEPTEEELQSEYLEFIKPILVNRIQQLSDNKLKEIKKLLAGRDITPEQEERYRIKYQKALKAKESKDYSEFEFEAKLIGKTPEELVNLIISMGQEWENKINEYAMVFDAIRVGLKNKLNIINNIKELDDLSVIIKKLKNIPNTASVNDYIKVIG